LTRVVGICEDRTVSDATGRAILAMPITNDQEIPGWVHVLRTASEAGHDSWEAFEHEVRQLADAFDAHAVDAFLQTVAAEHGLELIQELLDLEHQLPELYLAHTGHGPPAEAHGGGPFDWVAGHHQAALTQHWGSAWQERLSADLDQRWGADWTAHPEDHKTAWLDDLIAGGAFAGSTSDDPFGWVSESQRSSLSEVWGTGWHEHLSADLEQRWGSGWTAQPHEHKTAWLQDLIAGGAFAPAAEEPKPDTATDQEIIAAAMEVPGFAELDADVAAQVLAEALERAGKQ
jgi:hypothetical protein